jgi:hypothetical protein
MLPTPQHLLPQKQVNMHGVRLQAPQPSVHGAKLLLLPTVLQAITEAASIHVQSAAGAPTASADATGVSPAAWTPSLVARLLASYGRLGYAAPQLLVTALLPVMVPHLGCATAGDVVLLLEQLGRCQYQVSPWVSKLFDAYMCRCLQQEVHSV